MYNFTQSTLPGFEIYLKCSRWHGMALILHGRTAFRYLAKKLTDYFRKRLPLDWRAKRMEQTFYTKPDQPPLIEHFLILHQCGGLAVYEFIDAQTWHFQDTRPGLLLGNYFTTTYHCSFSWYGIDFSTQEAYDLVKRFYNPHRV